MAGTSIGQSVPAGEALVQDKFLTLNALRFHYREWGSSNAPPLVLLHGFSGNARHWDTLALALAQRYRVLALDQRGHGETDWAPAGDYMPVRVNEDFAGFVEAIEIARFPIVGFSFGGHVAYSYAAAHPERVERLVLVESTVPPSTPAMRAHMEALRNLQEVFSDADEAVRVFKAAHLAPYAPDDELRHWVHSGLKQETDGRWTWRLDPAFRVPAAPGRARLTQPADVMWSLLPRVTCPTLLVRGVETVAFPIDLADQMATALPDARVATIPDAGHWTPLDNPAAFVKVVWDFLANE
jgi:pimeloyl-ACP methyl ester carboxylesterase